MATNQKKIFLLPGDGIGPEVVGETKKVIDWFNKKKSLDFKIDQDLNWWSRNRQTWCTYN